MQKLPEQALSFLVRRTEVRLGEDPASRYGYSLRGFEGAMRDAGSPFWISAPARLSTALQIRWEPEVYWTIAVQPSERS